MRKLIKSVFNKIGITIISNKNDVFKKQNVLDPFSVQQRLFSDVRNLIIFDVGAHHGETALEYNKRFDSCIIYSFEPFKKSFVLLDRNVSGYSNINTFNLALGEVASERSFNSNSSSSTNSFLETHAEGAAIWGEHLLETMETIKVNVTTIDDFVEKQKIREIHILKIDVQGYEYNVIEGAKMLIAQHGIKMIYLEIILLPTYKGQKHLDEVLALLRTYNFSLYNVYNYSYDSFGSLRQIDAIFLSNVYRASIFYLR